MTSMMIELNGDSGISCVFGDDGILISYTGESAKYYGESRKLYPYSEVAEIKRILGSIHIEWKDGSHFNIVPVGIMGKTRVDMNRAILYTKERMEQ